jgi:SAM-dependent methyltransferase
MAEPQQADRNQTIVEDLQVDFHPELSDAETDRVTLSSSINSAVTNFREEHGRRYHAFEESQYWLPNDDIEIARLDLQHHCWRLSVGALYLSPISEGVHNIIDIGTGAGQWAIEFADAHPCATVIGTDLSPIQPVWTPPNCSWLIDNAEQEWVYPKKFDFVHSRMLMMGIHDWPRYWKQAYDNLKPGGWVEVLEPEFPVSSADNREMTEADSFYLWSKYMREAAAIDGIDTMVTAKFKKQLEEQGFVNIHEQGVRWPLGAWPKGKREKILGQWALENTKIFLSPSALALFKKRLGWTTEAVEKFLVGVNKDLEDNKKHYYWQL